MIFSPSPSPGKRISTFSLFVVDFSSTDPSKEKPPPIAVGCLLKKSVLYTKVITPFEMVYVPASPAYPFASIDPDPFDTFSSAGSL